MLVYSCSLKSNETLSKDDTYSDEELLLQFRQYLFEYDTINAIRTLEKYNDRNPNNLESKSFLIVLKFTSGQIEKDKGLRQIEEIYQSDTSNYWTKQLNLSRVIDEEPAEVALKALDKMIKEYPNEFDNYFEKGKILIRLERYDEATIMFDKAIELEPDNKYPYAQKALVKYLKGDKDGACNDWKVPGGGAMAYYEKYCK